MLPAHPCYDAPVIPFARNSGRCYLARPDGPTPSEQIDQITQWVLFALVPSTTHLFRSACLAQLAQHWDSWRSARLTALARMTAGEWRELGKLVELEALHVLHAEGKPTLGMELARVADECALKARWAS